MIDPILPCQDSDNTDNKIIVQLPRHPRINWIAENYTSSGESFLSSVGLSAFTGYCSRHVCVFVLHWTVPMCLYIFYSSHTCTVIRDDPYYLVSSPHLIVWQECSRSLLHSFYQSQSSEKHTLNQSQSRNTLSTNHRAAI